MNPAASPRRRTSSTAHGTIAARLAFGIPSRCPCDWLGGLVTVIGFKKESIEEVQEHAQHGTFAEGTSMLV